MGLVVDTSVFIALERNGIPEPVDLVQLIAGDDEPVAVSAVTAMELLVGVHCAHPVNRRRRRGAYVDGILDNVPVLAFDFDVARVHARIWAQMLSAGQSIPDRDLMIAATAVANGFDLLTEDLRHFDRVPDLNAIRPDW